MEMQYYNIMRNVDASVNEDSSLGKANQNLMP